MSIDSSFERMSINEPYDNEKYRLLGIDELQPIVGHVNDRGEVDGIGFIVYMAVGEDARIEATPFITSFN